MPEKQLTGDNSSELIPMYKTYAMATHVFYHSLRNMYCNAINEAHKCGCSVFTSKYVHYVGMYDISSDELSLSR